MFHLSSFKQASEWPPHAALEEYLAVGSTTTTIAGFCKSPASQRAQKALGCKQHLLIIRSQIFLFSGFKNVFGIQLHLTSFRLMCSHVV